MAESQNPKLDVIRRIELAINRNLFLVTTITTVIVIGIGLAEFFTRGAFPAMRIHIFYIGLVVFYSIHKEMLRWLDEKEVERKGEWFVYVWIGVTLALYLINFASKGYFSTTAEGDMLETLNTFSILTLEVIGIFLIARLSKVIKVHLRKK